MQEFGLFPRRSTWFRSHRGGLRFAVTAFFLFAGVTSSFGQQASAPTDTAVVASEYGKLPLSFQSNQGQNDRQVRFTSRGNGYSLFLTDSAAVLSLSKAEAQPKSIGPKRGAAKGLTADTTTVLTDVVRIELVGVAPSLRVAGTDELAGEVNYFIGSDPAKWHSDIPIYGRVKYSSVYPGVDLVYYGNQQQLEYDFVVSPGADAKPLRLHFAGAENLTLNDDGDLTVSAKNGEIAFHKPVVYQMKDGKREPVEGSFKLLARNDVGFVLGKYDHSRELVIDPTLAYSTYLGGSFGDGANAIAVDAAGDAYVTGIAASSNFPTTAGSYQPTKPGGTYTPVIFVTKFNPQASALIYSTFLGGTVALGDDRPEGIAVNAAGDAYITGQTFSPDFPLTPGAFQDTNKGYPNGNLTGFVTRLNSTGSKLIYSTFLGGSGGGQDTNGDFLAGIAVDSAGHAYVTGATESLDFPVTANAFQQSNPDGSGNPSGFVTKLQVDGKGLVYSTYLGGSGTGEGSGDGGLAIALDSTDHAYVTGDTGSADFPITADAYQTTSSAIAGMNFTPFVTKLNQAGSGLLYSTFLGGSGEDFQTVTFPTGDAPVGIAVDADNDIYIAGNSASTDFPLVGAFQTAGGMFLAKLNPNFAGKEGLFYSTYLGGNGSDHVAGIALDSVANVYLTGTTTSSNFPVTKDAFQPVNPSPGLGGAAFLAEMNVNVGGTGGLIHSTYYGGNGGGSSASGIAVDTYGNAYIAGGTYSSTFPVSAGAFQTATKCPANFVDCGNGFVGKIWPLAITPTPSVTGIPSTLNFGETVVGASKILDVTLTNTGKGSFEFTDFLIDPGAPAEFSGQTLTCNTIIGPGGSCTFSVTFSPTFATTYNGYISFQVTDGENVTRTFIYFLTGTGFFLKIHHL
jgi:hypothetical protein